VVLGSSVVGRTTSHAGSAAQPFGLQKRPTTATLTLVIAILSTPTTAKKQRSECDITQRLSVAYYQVSIKVVCVK